MRCHEVDYTIIGHDIQMVELALDPGEAVIAEAGAITEQVLYCRTAS